MTHPEKNRTHVISLSCPNCGGRIVSTPFGLSKEGTCRCEYCGSQVALPGPAAPPVPPPVLTRPELRPQAGVTILRTARGFRISYRWYGPRAWIYGGGALMANLFAWLIVGRIFGPAFLFTFFLPVTLGALVLLYIAVVEFFNSTHITASQNTLYIEHGPLPSGRKRRKISIPQIQQLFTKMRLEHYNDGADLDVYDLVAKLEGGERVELVRGVPTPELGIYLEQQIEKRLQIVDVPVAGELPRGRQKILD
jgi:hypothetical protein